MSFKDFYSGSLMALLFGGAEPFMQIGHHREHKCVKLFGIWTSGSGDVI